MLQKWKSILINWINCYFNDSRSDKNLNLESLLNIISHLRENLNLDESKSSKISAHNVEEFIIEKYPEFKFENGTVEATNEEQVCLVASLLLYFVCVNSKDIDIKSAMCSKLSDADQEIILKFSKSLMDCSPILCRDVQAAIADACGHDVAIPSSMHAKVTETPPALRSLHSEVRRLQAALDAERFDRNYLQDELNRTNLRVEKLLKEKEEYKMDIVDLKTKISLCCGQEDEAKGLESSSDKSAKLARQLQEMEERLVQTQGELDDAVYQRDTYKAKVEELKQDRDKWLTLSQQETLRASQLSDELETERRNTHSLRELVNELRQHNRLNRIDSSFLECDDPDTSIQSLPHNSSVCSEVCANVVEVQLGEERAKIVVLHQQIEAFQVQINELTRKSEEEKLTLETIITERETDIFNLKHRINEEIEEKNNLKVHFSDEMSKLNNEINELEQKLKDNNDHSRTMIEQKLQEIQTLQEEKLSLLQSLSDETTKLENIIKDLKTNIETERQSKMNMKESYDSHIMKLNEKMLNRNNELVELQNNVFEKSETIESLHLDLRKEKEIREAITDKYHNDLLHLTEQKNTIEHCLQERMRENTELANILEQKTNMIEGLYREVDNLKRSLSNCNDKCKLLEEDKSKLINEVQSRDMRLEEIYKDIENLKNVFSEERDKLCFDLDERNATVNALKMQLQNEIHYKIGLENELKELQKVKAELLEKLNKTSVEITELHSKIEEKDENIKHMDSMLQKEINNNKQLKSTNEKLNTQLKKLIDDLKLKNNEIKLLNGQEKELNKSFDSEMKSKNNIIEKFKTELASSIDEKGTLQVELNSLRNQNVELEKAVAEKTDTIIQIQKQNTELSRTLEEDKKAIETLHEKLQTLHQKYTQLEHTFDKETSKMISKLNDTEKTIKELSTSSKKTLNKKEFQIQTLNMELDNVRKVLETNQTHVNTIQNEKHALIEKLEEQIVYRNKIEEEYQTQCAMLVEKTAKFNEELHVKNAEIDSLKAELQAALQTVEDKCSVIKKLEDKITVDSELIYEKGNKVKEIQAKLTDMESLNDELEQELKKEINSKQQMIQALQKENEQLHFTIEEDNSNHELLIKEKDRIIDTLEQQLKVSTVQLEALKKDYEDMTLNWEKLKIESHTNIEAKVAKLNQLRHQVVNLEQKLEKAEKSDNARSEQIQELVQHIEEMDAKAQEEKAVKDSLETENKNVVAEVTKLLNANKEMVNTITILTQTIAEEKALRNVIEHEKSEIELELGKIMSAEKILLDDKECLTQQLLEEKSAKDLAEREKENIVKEKLLLEKMLNAEENKIVMLKQEINELNHKHVILENIIRNEKSAEELAEKEKQSIVIAKSLLEQKLSAEQSKIIDLNHAIVELKEILKAEKNAKELAETEKNTAVAEKHQLEQKIIAAENKITTLNQEINELIHNKVILEEIIKIEKSAMELVEKEKHNLIQEKQVLEQNNVAEKNKIVVLKQEITDLTEKYETLEKVVKTEKSTKEALERQIENIVTEKQILEQKLNVEESKTLELKHEINDIVDKHTTLNETSIVEKERLHGELNKERARNEELLKEKEWLAVENKSLKHEITNNTAIKEALESQKIQLIEEKQTLAKSVSEEKSALDEMQNEKNVLRNQIEEISEQYNSEISTKATEIASLKTEIQCLQKDLQGQLQNNKEVFSVLNDALVRITQNIRKEDITNEVLQKLLAADTTQMNVVEECDLLINIVDSLFTELKLRKNLEKALEDENTALSEMQEICKQKEMQILDLQTELKRVEQVFNEKKIEMSKQTEVHTTAVNTKARELQQLQHENETLRNDLNDVKLQLEVKVYSLKEKLTDNELLTDKLKRSYECQIDNLNMMITKLTAYLKDKTVELEMARKEKDTLQHTIEENLKVIKSLESEVQTEKKNQQKLISDFESERLVLKNMVTVTESVMEDQKISLNNIIAEHVKINESLQEENKILKDELENEKNNTELKLQDKDVAIEKSLKELAEVQEEKIKIEKQLEAVKENMDREIKLLRDEITLKSSELCKSQIDNKTMEELVQKHKHDVVSLQEAREKLELELATLKAEAQKKIDDTATVLNSQKEICVQLEAELKEKTKLNDEIQKEVKKITERLLNLEQEKHVLELASIEWKDKFEELQERINLNSVQEKETIETLEKEKIKTTKEMEDQRIVITNLEQLIKHELEENQMLRDDNANEKLTLVNKFSLLQDWQTKAEKDIEEKHREIVHLQEEVVTLRAKIENYEHDLKAKDVLISEIGKEKDAIISTISKELLEEKTLKEKWQKECENKIAAFYDKQAVEAALRKENEQLVKAVGDRETFAAQNAEKSNSCPVQERDRHQQKQLYQEQIGVFKEKQKEEVSLLERELQKAREKLSESSRAYEQHIRALTAELWSVGEKFLMKKDEAEWLRKKQRSGSLMSLQHVHSSGLAPPQEEPGRPSDSHSLRSLPVHNNTKREGRGMHMSDEEGEVFDNRFLKELSTPCKEREPAAGAGAGVRLSELRWRNSLCPPHLKSSYPAETQFAPALDEEDIKFAAAAPGRPQRKEVGITAYKKPGPPTPSKQAGRLSATDSELRESLRVEADPQPSRKTSTPSRLRAMFRFAKNETNEGTPRTRRLSNIFGKK
ncbi:golgin subfamily A member 4-like isoform X2 [Manduca sexta]|uniref:golgin subfamily A member 4-like isoform X2 n=1 Tax=Manduca sexta TaxID=7130 RepID=UPI00188DDB21|nr:golgin subfamily A member 4-like isoform X2 [Manduca sexta]